MSAPRPARNPDPAPRGIRNHNPGNIRHNAAITWRGQAGTQRDPEFVQFDTPEWGLRAICRVLFSYAQRGVRTPRAIAARWAPPVGQRPDGSRYTQDSTAYARHLAAAIGAGLDQVVDVRDPAVMGGLLRAIVRHENGVQPYPDEVFRRAMDLAGLDVPPPAAPSA